MRRHVGSSPPLLLLGLLFVLTGSNTSQVLTAGGCDGRVRCTPKPNPTPYIEPQGEGCRALSFGHDSVVCVCDATHCDLPGPSPDPTPERYTLVTSTRAGQRFHTATPLLVDSPEPGGLLLEVATASPRQTMEGFGSSFTDAATITTHALSPQAQDLLIRSYFGPEGLEYDLVRVPIAGSDFSTRPYSYLDDHRDLQHFALAPEDTQHKLPLLRRALEVSERPLKVLASPWSPPAWMKTNGILNDISEDDLGHLLPEMWQQWALYLVRFLQEYEAAGVKMWGITTQNHAFTTATVAWNSCHWTPEDMRDWTKRHLKPALTEAGLEHLKVLVGDDTRNKIDEFRNVIFGDDDEGEASGCVDGMAVHWYHDNTFPPTLLDRTHLLYPNKFILYTEACIVPHEFLAGPELQKAIGTESVALGSWVRAELYAKSIIETSNHHVSGWIDWNFALDTQGGPNWAGNTVDSPIIINAEKDEFYKQPMYYAMGHFSKFVPAGSVAVPSWIQVVGLGTQGSSDKEDIEKDLHTTAFIHPNCHLVVVILNVGEEEHVVNYRTDSGKFAIVRVAPRSMQTLLVAWEEEERSREHDEAPSYKYTQQAQGGEGQC